MHKTGMDRDPVSGEKLQALAKEIIDQPPEVSVNSKKYWNFSQEPLRLRASLRGIALVYPAMAHSFMGKSIKCL